MGEAVDPKDCYFDEECHKLVDWSKVGKIKMGFFIRLKSMRKMKDTTRLKPMLQKIHQMFVEAGMPENRVDYTLEKWVKHIYPEAFEEKTTDIAPDSEGCYDKGEDGVWCPKGDDWYCMKNCKGKQKKQIDQAKMVDKNDCYFDSECHKLVNWGQVGRIKMGFLARLKYMQKKQDVTKVRPLMDKVRLMFVDAGMPDDRAEYVLEKWAKSVFPEALDEKTPEVASDSKDCFDKGQHGVWCPKGKDWYCVRNCQAEQKREDAVVV